MAYAATMPGFTSEHRSGLAISIAVHGLLLLGMSTSLMLVPKAPLQLMAIEAVIIDEGAIRRAAEEEQRRAEIAQQRQRQEEARQTQLVAEQQAAAEQQRLDQLKRAEAVRLQAESKRIEQQQLDAKQRSIEERKQREAAARAETERQRMLVAAEREERERREAEMLTAMQEEESLLAARQSGEMSQYVALIQQKVIRNWVRPASAQTGLECEVAVVQLPNGDVIDAHTVRCNGDETVRRSIENAVRRSSPLPLPNNRVLFDRNLTFTFRPE